jgi:hypothetical protein
VPMNPLFRMLGTGRPRSVETAFPQLHRLNKADTFPSLLLRLNRESSKLSPCQITPYPTCQVPRNNVPLNLPRSHEIPWRGTVLLPLRLWGVNVHISQDWSRIGFILTNSEFVRIKTR